MTILSRLVPRRRAVPPVAAVPARVPFPIAARPVVRPPVATPPAAVTPPGPPSPYAALIARIRATTDPRQRAILQDQLARTIASDLQKAGHKVTWKGDHLMVDGRPYVVAGMEVVDPLHAAVPAAGAPTPPAAGAAPMPHAGGPAVHGGVSPQVAKLVSAAHLLTARYQAERNPREKAALAGELVRLRQHLRAIGGAR